MSMTRTLRWSSGKPAAPPSGTPGARTEPVVGRSVVRTSSTGIWRRGGDRLALRATRIIQPAKETERSSYFWITVISREDVLGDVLGLLAIPHDALHSRTSSAYRAIEMRLDHIPFSMPRLRRLAWRSKPSRPSPCGKKRGRAPVVGRASSACRVASSLKLGLSIVDPVSSVTCRCPPTSLSSPGPAGLEKRRALTERSASSAERCHREHGFATNYAPILGSTTHKSSIWRYSSA